MSESALISIAQRMQELKVEKGFKVICQDDIGDTFYVLEEGEVEVTVSQLEFVSFVIFDRSLILEKSQFS